jgi:hypothetical protein
MPGFSKWSVPRSFSGQNSVFKNCLNVLLLCSVIHNLVSNIKGVWKQGAEENIWT